MSDYQQQLQQQGCKSNIVDGPISCGEQDDDEQSIIDVFEFDDTAHDRWLCSAGTGSRRNSNECKIQDLDAWLHADILESETAYSDNALRKSIDSRTFTRIKRRSNKLNFESVESISLETMSIPTSNVWKNQTITESISESTQKERRDSIPMMLRPKTNQVLAALLSESPSSINSQTSMEAFVNMTRSKEGINSILSDMSESDVNHFLMNISQPSLLYSSIISDGKGEESMHAAVHDSFVDSQILTDSMMEASMFKEVQDTTMLAEFLKQSNDSTILEDTTIRKSLNESDIDDATFDNNYLNDKIHANVKSKINETFINLPSPVASNSEINSTKIISSQENLLHSSRVDTNIYSPLNSTKTISSDNDTTVLLQDTNDLSKTCIISKENKTDLIYESKSESLSSSEEKLNATFKKSNISTPLISQELVKNIDNKFDKFHAVPTLRAALLQEVQRSSGNKFDTTLDGARLPGIESNFDVTYDCLNTNESFVEAEVLDATYIQVQSPHKLESQSETKSVEINSDSAQVNTQSSNAIGSRQMSYVKKSVGESQMHSLDQNRFNTFRKDSKIGSCFSKLPQEDHSNKMPISAPLQHHIPKNNDTLYQQRFHTFSKKTSSMRSKVCVENNVNEMQSDDKFTKPLDKISRQIQAPRQLSKLPQLFQKSNPNLGASFKSIGKLTMETENDVEFVKGSQPNISSNMCSLGRFKSERILQTKNNTDFSMADSTSRSMESIESTASAHSAPDIEDRLSISSESSRASYTIKSKDFVEHNAEGQDGKYSGLVSKPKGHNILEGTWIQEKDLPSPILKNHIKRCYVDSGDSNSTSPTDSAEFNAKTSSPLTISPTSSDQAIDRIESDDVGIEVAKENIQATVNVKPTQIKICNSASNMTNARKLRLPTNWTGAPNKIANSAISGIPRPASRIPGPKFVRPNLK
ncbi:PREDICTED: uncharacterized protein LOC105365560 isoform X2 [Ceratosolen solmsi marchali]|uniref:Uncharacterized protein LOC105365560 isoform X2 n=1 Tax=Ceratosolen solmsi marchali TaxID=326594 RepID=A0AAJ6YPY0_9HYME|nr:PREDICTED: uncharacterized protein LOC105365560 isoform X2 [Ceratosolen solmsi marchali]